MKVVIFCLLILSVFFAPRNLRSEEQLGMEDFTSEGVTLERMAILKLLMQKDLILTFVSHPKTMEHFLKERQRKNDYYLSLRMEIESLQRQFPSDPAAKRFSEEFLSQIELIQNPFPYEEIVMPFLAWGVASLYGVEDALIIKKMEDFQVQLFKNYLCRERIGHFGKNLTKEIERFSQNCPLPIFSQIIRPLMQALLKQNADIDDIVDFYSSHKLENLSDEQQKELEDVYDPPKPVIIPPLKLDPSKLNIEFDDAFWEELEKHLSPCGQERCPSEDAIDSMCKRFESQNFFSVEQLIDLFFEVIIEAYPDRKEFFRNIQHGKIVN